MRQFFDRHWEKVVALVVVGLCVWGFVRTAMLLTASAAASDDDETIEAVRTALREASPMEASYKFADEPRDYSADVGSILGCIGYAGAEIGAVDTHFVYPLAPKTKGAVVTIDLVRPNFLSPVLKAVDAGRGKVEIVIVQNPDDDFIKLLRFELFRKEGGKDYGEKPFKVLTPEGVGTAAGRRAGRGEEEPVLHQKTGGSARTAFEDEEVEPKATYAYKVRAIGVADVPRRRQPEPETPEEGSGAHVPGGSTVQVRRKKIEVIRPIGVEELDLDGTAAWITPFSDEQSVETPTNVELVLTGIMGDDPDWRARIKIRQWNRKIDDWDEGDFSIEEEEPVQGSKIIRYETGQKRVKFDSGYVLTKIERVMETTRRKKKVPVQQPDGTIVLKE